MKLIRTATVLAVLVALFATASAGAAAKKSTLRLGPNLVVNPSFESSTLDPATANGIPVLPVGWTFEGATVLFDYNQHGARTGTRQVAISGSLAPGKQVCDASANGSFMCVANPAASVTDPLNESSLSSASIRPFWVGEKGIPVTAGTAYRFSMWSARPSLSVNDGVVGEGTASKVRWLDASGSTISVVDGSSSLKVAKRQIGYRLTSADLVAPAKAVGAKLMLGHTNYTVTSVQVAFDDISFQEILHR